VRPKLQDLKVIWINISDSELLTKNSELCFDSLEDAQEYFESENREILTNIAREEGSKKSVEERQDLEQGFLARVENGL
jgi:hypothetical protein